MHQSITSALCDLSTGIPADGSLAEDQGEELCVQFTNNGCRSIPSASHPSTPAGPA